MIGVLVRMTFLNLLDRKDSGYIQLPKGRAKVGFIGLVQPFNDALKIFPKEQAFPLDFNFVFYYLCVFNLTHPLALWFVFPFLGPS